MFKKIQNFEILKVILGSKRSKKDSKSYKIAIFTQSLFFLIFEVFLAFWRTHTFTTKHSLIPIWDFLTISGICQIKTEL